MACERVARDMAIKQHVGTSEISSWRLVCKLHCSIVAPVSAANLLSKQSLTLSLRAMTDRVLHKQLHSATAGQ